MSARLCTSLQELLERSLSTLISGWTLSTEAFPSSLLLLLENEEDDEDSELTEITVSNFCSRLKSLLPAGRNMLGVLPRYRLGEFSMKLSCAAFDDCDVIFSNLLET